MIKRDEYEKQIQQETDPTGHVMLLAAALGFKFENGAYVKAGKRAYTRKTATKRPYKRAARAVAAPERTFIQRKRKGPSLPETAYQQIRDLPVGGEVDVTEVVRTFKITFDSLTKRLSTFQWKERQSGRTGVSWRVRRANGRVIIHRAA